MSRKLLDWMIEAVKASIEFKSTEMPECSLGQVGEWLVTSYITHKAEKGERAADPLKYFQQAMYPHSHASRWGAQLSQPITRQRTPGADGGRLKCRTPWSIWMRKERYWPAP